MSFKHCVMKIWRGVEVVRVLHSSVLHGSEWLASRPDRFIRGEAAWASDAVWTMCRNIVSRFRNNRGSKIHMTECWSVMAASLNLLNPIRTRNLLRCTRSSCSSLFLWAPRRRMDVWPYCSTHSSPRQYMEVSFSQPCRFTPLARPCPPYPLNKGCVNPRFCAVAPEKWQIACPWRESNTTL